MRLLATAGALVWLLASCSKVPAHRQKCLTLRVGMPVSELVKVMGRPQETLGGDLTSYIYGRRSYDETSIDTIAVSEKTQKVVSVVCGDRPIRQFYSGQDAEDDQEQAQGETSEGRRLQSQNGAALHALKLALQKWQSKNGGWAKHPAALGELGSYLPQGMLPELTLPKHGVSRWVEAYPPEACAREGDIARIDGSKLRDTGQWGYVAEGDGPCAGHIFIDCTHHEGRGRRWFEQF